MSDTKKPAIHIIGAGLAGLSTAVQLVERGHAVSVYEAAPQAGGRCRSFDDPVLGCRIDNGNHLLLSGNQSAVRYLKRIDAEELLWTANEAAFPFYDLQTRERWTLRPNADRLPWWVFAEGRRVPGTMPWHYLSAWRLFLAGQGKSAADMLPRNGLFTRFWEPLTVAALNAVPERASARLLWRALSESFAKGGDHCRPMIAREGLSEALIEPAVRFIEQRDGRVCYGQRLRGFDINGSRASALAFNDKTIPIGSDERVVLAVPPTQLRRLLPELPLPEDQAVILNAHFRLQEAVASPGSPQFLGLTGATAHWLFVRGDIASVTISAADQLGLADADEEELMPVLWREVQQSLGLEGTGYRAGRLIRERRATFDQSPDGVALRPKTDIGYQNIVLAGDFTDTGLPATIEGAIRSGETAARAVCR